MRKGFQGEGFQDFSHTVEPEAAGDEVEVKSDISEQEPVPEAAIEQSEVVLTEESVNSAESIEDLISLVESAKKIIGAKEEGEYTSDYVAGKIEAFRDFLIVNMEELQMSVILGRPGEINTELTKKLLFIPTGLGLRKKVRDLMAELWKKEFQNNRHEIIERTIKEANSVEELCKAIKYFRYIKSETSDETYDTAKAIQNIESADKKIAESVRSGELPTVDVMKINELITDALDSNLVPQEFGIYNRAHQLIYNKTSETIKENKFQKHVSSLSSDSSSKGIWGSVKKGFSKLAFWKK